MHSDHAETSTIEPKSNSLETHFRRRVLALLLVVPLIVSPAAYSQTQGSIADALLKLRTLRDRISTIDGRLYGGNITSQIFHTGSLDKVEANDTMYMHLAAASGRNIPSLDCGTQQSPKTKAAFDQCVTEHVAQVVEILFPSGLASSVSGKDAAQNHAELFLLTTALGVAAPSRETRRTDIGGLVEHEWFSGTQMSGNAWQGLYQLSSIPVSFHGRYANQEDTVKTKSITASADVHPSFKLASSLDWRAGFDAHSGILYSRSSPLNGSSGLDPLQLGSIDYGGGVWSAVHRDFSRVRVGGATLFQASKSHVPAIGDKNFEFVTESMNQRPVAYDISYGGLAGFLLSDRSSLNGKFLETRSLNSESNPSANLPIDHPNLFRPPARLGMVSFSYLFGGVTPIDFGYKITTAGGVTGHSIFVLGNFHW